MKRSLPFVASAAAGLLTAASASLAASPSDQVLTSEGHRFACTGVGSDTRNDPRWADFPVKMVFTNKDGDYLGDVAVTVKGAGGAVVLEAHCAAPWLMAELEAGSYSADLVAEGQYKKSISFKVGGAGQTQVVVPFPEVPGT